MFYEISFRLEEAQANFVKISKVIKVEIDFFERYRVKDFKNAIILYLVRWVNFTNILQAAFTHADPNSAKKTVKSRSFLRFWDLHMYKFCINTLMKSTPEASIL